jgi:hypothetical protein
VIGCFQAPPRIIRMSGEDAHIVAVFCEPPSHVTRIFRATNKFWREVERLD